jgi:Ca-activated chloride channel homolog
MKKLLIAVTLLLLVATLVLSACGSKTPLMTSSSEPYTPSHTSATSSTSKTQPSMSSTSKTVTTTKTMTYTTTPRTTLASQTPTATKTTSGSYYTTPSETIGLATGGAKDIGNFRENIRNNYLPLPTDITYEGLFYDYYFDTGMYGETNKLFNPSYSFAVTRDPLSHQTEYYMAVGLNSGLRENDFQRKKLNLVIVLDNSGSMGEKYTEYYYDQYGNPVDTYEEEGIHRALKIESAEEAIVSILDQLNDGDRLGIVTFNSNASLVKPMGWVGQADMRDIRNMVLDIPAGGSTNLDAGIDMATAQFGNNYEWDNYDYENRMIVLTDAQPNTGDINSSNFLRVIKNNAGNRIYTTFIGVGVDFNSQLIDEITKVKGANYYSVHSPRQFRERVEEEFEYMVTPLIFDVKFRFESDGWRIDKVFGSPEADQSTGELMRINTLFASKSEGGENKGGLVLLKLKKTSSNSEDGVYLKVTYEDRDGRRDSSQSIIYPERTSPEYFDNNGIRKGILLTRYAALLKNWTIDERQHMNYSQSWNPCVNEDTGIVLPDDSNFSQWERQSLPLYVSEPYHSLFRDFRDYFKGEMYSINDETLDQELEILYTLD